MRIRRLVSMGTLLLGMTLPPSYQTWGQSTPVPLTEEEQKEKLELEKKAMALLDQVISDAQSLRLPENRIRIQINVGDLIWDRDQGRARALFMEASAGINEQVRNIDTNDRQYSNLLRVPTQLRQELVLTAARHDSTLAYQILASTRPPAAPVGARGRGQGPSPQDAEANLERNLLAQIAASDPKLALQNAEGLLEKGEYSSAMASVLAQLQDKDKEAAVKFQEKLIRKLQSDNLLTSPGASGLAMALLRPGPRLPAETAATTQSVTTSRSPALGINAFRDLMESVIAAALKATPAARGGAQPSVPGNTRGPGNARGGQTQQNRGQASATSNQTSTQTAAQVEQSRARGLLGELQLRLPQIDLYLPARGPAVRQKMTELGMNSEDMRAMVQMGNSLQQGTSESILAAAATAPPQVQSRLYQQAAFKALEEGDADGARKIANDHLDANTKASVLQRIDVEVATRTGTAEKIEEMRQSASNVKNEEERIRLLLQLAAGAEKQNPKLALELLEEARNIVSSRPTSYQQFESQLRVARALATVDAAKAIEVLEPGISQLNDLLSAAALLSGFEVNIFKNGELPLQGGSNLAGTVNRYSQQIASLAKSNFDLAASGADKFQLTEPKIMVRLSIVRTALGKGQVQADNGAFGFGGGRPMGSPDFSDRRQP